MSSETKPAMVILTNLYPLPWEPNRATFNRQQFALLEDQYDLSILIPVPFVEWFRHRRQIQQSERRRYLPYFYPPKLGRRFYGYFMLFSVLLHSGLWLYRRRPRLLLASWAFPEGVAGAWLSRLLGARFFIKVHGSDINLHGKIPPRARQIAAAADRASAILSVSAALAGELEGLGVSRDKVYVIYNGVDHERFTPGGQSRAEQPYILYVGNLKRDKGVSELLEGFAAIAAEHPALQLKYAGQGPMAETLRSRAEAMGLASRVELLGTVDHARLAPLMAAATALALPSYNEGVPNVVLEAMACGVPVLATRVGGIPEVMEEGVTGCLIEPRDATEVSRGLSLLLQGEWASDRIARHARGFSWDKNRGQLLAMLQRGRDADPVDSPGG